LEAIEAIAWSAPQEVHSPNFSQRPTKALHIPSRA
jgi:hypothetical protein